MTLALRNLATRVKPGVRVAITRDIPQLAPSTPAAGRDVCVARQPIFDDRLQVVGFELLVHASGQADERDRSHWTSRLIVEAFSDVGLEALTGGCPAWLPVGRDLLLEVGSLPVRPDRVVLQLRVDGPLDFLLEGAVREMTGRGYHFAVEGPPAGSAAEALRHATYKLDFGMLGIEGLRESLRDLGGGPPAPVVTGIETREDLALCRGLGFRLFQGGFLARPDVKRGRAAPVRLQALSTMANVFGIGADFEALERVVVRDIALSHKLLRYANSALFMRPQRVSSVHEAMLILGANAVRRWTTVMVLSGVPDEPHGLIALALVRARICELLADDPGRRDEAFTVGLFSVIDALLGVSMDEALAGLPLADDVLDALRSGAGPDGLALRCILAWERGDFAVAEQLPGGAARFTEAYRAAVAWADEAAATLDQSRALA